ncbi:hypothetical protein BO94DRAFT_590928 [Aspergillus sclerotioniger CBS 115572]|uniref:Uncharacterized protein n=1 Tax=Aspergillus sclerotioniger CBS 115572 TaxID=1450535 RepID=A0A317V0N5_9EURO|nr:hypothetical protein BO94DRAFT_590928 [Aspergillus sclerotioniger CBS 115572]PWY67229.1 hypothetical protein BO94DRAFT_590928 [Aspergillus sclerotioniger CBS 115572]
MGRIQTGTVTGNIDGRCDVGPSKENILGCGVRGGPETYGEGFNSHGGGVYILEVCEEGIKVWVFSREVVPGDVLGIIDTDTYTYDDQETKGKNNNKKTKYTNKSRENTPNPQTWGPPLAHFPNTNCNIGDHFKDLKIIANIDLCGQNAGHPAVYNDQDGCPGTCEEFVRGNLPELAEEAYWEFGGFWVFQVV